MYILHQCTQENTIINHFYLPNVFCFNHLNCLAKSIEYIFHFGKYLKSNEGRLAVLQHTSAEETIIIGRVDKEGIYDKINELVFSFKGLHETSFTVEYMEIEIKSGKVIPLNQRRRENGNKPENGIRSLARMITFLARPLGAHYDKVRYKQAILLKNGNPMYIVNNNGIFSTENKELLDFWQFYVSIEYGLRISETNNLFTL